MKVLNDLYDYGYKIYQDTDFFKFSLDSILLAEFIHFKKNDKILDLCTGNIPVPLILHSKNDNLDITAVEVQKKIYDLALDSLKINNINNGIKVINADILNLDLNTKYDIISCNPPYFNYGDVKVTNDIYEKSKARHEINLTIGDVIKVANKFIKENGTFYIVHRPNRLIDIIRELKKYNFGIRRICFIYTKPKSEAKILLLEASKCKKDDIKIYSENVMNLKTYQNLFKGEIK